MIIIIIIIIKNKQKTKSMSLVIHTIIRKFTEKLLSGKS